MTTLRQIRQKRGKKRLGIAVSLLLIGSTLNFLVQLNTVLNPSAPQRSLVEPEQTGQSEVDQTPASQRPIHTLRRGEPLTTKQVRELFNGGSFRSLASRVVGAAEGTRFPDGSKTRYWYGHEDPGDRYWNYGTFSFSFQRHGVRGDQTPERADQIYFAQIVRRLPAMIRQVQDAGIQLSLEEWLNFIDLRNQAPEAALGWSRRRQNPGYVANLIAMKQRGMKGQTAIIHARVECFRDQTTGLYQAWTGRSGLFRDQGRRSDAIRSALASWQAQMNGSKTVSLIDSSKLESLLQSNPYGTTWSTVEQKTDALYWQQGFLDAVNGNGPISQDAAYLQGFQAVGGQR